MGLSCECYVFLFCHRTIKNFLVRKGDAFSTQVVKQETDLSPEMIQRSVILLIVGTKFRKFNDVINVSDNTTANFTVVVGCSLANAK